MTRAVWRNNFDRDRDFVARRRVTVQGNVFAPGDAFDKTLVTTRKLRQLFDQRTIMFAGDTPGAILPKPEGARGRARIAAAQTDPDPRDAIDIPANWQDLPWPARLSLASKVSQNRVRSLIEVTAAIEAEIARRAQSA